MKGETDKIKLGALLSYVSVGINILSGLVYSPFIIQSVGKSEYAVYVLINSIISLFLLDFGLGSTASRFLSKYRAEGATDKINAFLACIYRLYLALDVVIVLAFTVTFFLLDSVYSTLSSSELTALKTAFAVSAVFSTLNFPFSPLGGVLTAYSEFVHIKLADILYRVVNLVLAVVALLSGGGIISIVLINGVCSTLVTAYKFITVKRKTQIKADFTYRDRETYREIVSFSVWSAISSLSQRLIFNITPSILGAFCGAAEIAVFGVITAIESYTYVVTNAIHGLFLPRVSKVYTEPEPEKELQKLMLSVGRFQYLINGLVIAVFVAGGREFLGLWVGEGYGNAYIGIILVTVPGLFFNSLHIVTTALSVTHRVHLYALMNLLTGAINVILSLVLSPRYGAVGACASIAAAYLFRTLALNFVSSKWLRLDMLGFSKKCYLKITPAIIFSAVAGIFISGTFNFGWTGFIIKSLVTASIYVLFTVIFDSEVRKNLIGIFAKRDMKKIFIDAYAKMNLGDDMFLLSLVRRYPSVRFFVRTQEKYSSAYSCEKNLTVLNVRKKNRILKQLEYRFKYDGYVKLGGSIFMERPGGRTRTPIPRCVSRIFNRNKFVIGANFGPYYTDIFLKRAKASLSAYRGVSFRDSYSAELFSEFENVTKAADILFGYRNYPEYVHGKGVGISVIAPEKKLTVDKYADRYYNIIVEICEALISRGIPVTLLGFCDFEGDGDAISRIISTLSDPSTVKILIYNGDVDGFLNEINACESIIASRFHASVIALAMKKKVYPIIYSPKQSNVLNDIGFDGDVWDMYNGHFPSAESIIDGCFSDKAMLDTDIFSVDSEKQFSSMDKFIN